MANKQKKKRNKQYSGIDAAVSRPVVTKISAANRTKIGQWWFDHKRILKPVLIGTGVVFAIVILILQIINIASR